MRGLMADFLVRYPKANVVAHATDQFVDIAGDNFEVASAHSDPLPDSNLVQRTLTTAPWFLFAGCAYLDANGPLDRPRDICKATLLSHDGGWGKSNLMASALGRRTGSRRATYSAAARRRDAVSKGSRQPQRRRAAWLRLSRRCPMWGRSYPVGSETIRC